MAATTSTVPRGKSSSERIGFPSLADHGSRSAGGGFCPDSRARPRPANTRTQSIYLAPSAADARWVRLSARELRKGLVGWFARNEDLEGKRALPRLGRGHAAWPYIWKHRFGAAILLCLVSVIRKDSQNTLDLFRMKFHVLYQEAVS